MDFEANMSSVAVFVNATSYVIVWMKFYGRNSMISSNSEQVERKLNQTFESADEFYECRFDKLNKSNVLIVGLRR